MLWEWTESAGGGYSVGGLERYNVKALVDGLLYRDTGRCKRGLEGAAGEGALYSRRSVHHVSHVFWIRRAVATAGSGASHPQAWRAPYNTKTRLWPLVRRRW